MNYEKKRCFKANRAYLLFDASVFTLGQCRQICKIMLRVLVFQMVSVASIDVILFANSTLYTSIFYSQRGIFSHDGFVYFDGNS